MIDEKKLEAALRALEAAMLDLGFTESNRGTGYLRMAVKLYEPGMSITKELYPAIARANNTLPTRVERCMRHAIDAAWLRGSDEAQRRLFGYTVNPEMGRPTVGEFIARMARYCRAN